jgi:1L-myo-inositol 1-phosphate cytidylyltransferase / CDP-L-myo-inositol myo-inositolphosphotransferase
VGSQPSDALTTSARQPIGRPRVGVVLAAGRSERLRLVTHGRSKLLIRLGGVTLVERAVRSLLAAGLERILVVVGHRSEATARAAREVAPDAVTVVRAERWEAGNGASLSAAEPALAGQGSFVLVCGDHVFAPGSLDGLMGAHHAAVLVDPAPGPDAWEEGTRVRVQGARAVAFGKRLEEPPVDCGAFVLTPEVFDCQRAASARGDDSLAGALTALAMVRPLEVLSLPEEGWWQDIDTPHDLRQARRLLRRSLVLPTDGPVSRYLNRPISTRISMALAPLRPSPNLLSVIALAFGMAAAFLLALERPLMGGLLVQASSVVDGIDGESARLQMRASARGAWLNGLLNRMVDAAVVAGLGIWMLSETLSTRRILLLLGGIGIAWAILAMAGMNWTTILNLPAATERLLGFSLGRRDGRLFLVTAWALLGHPMVALVAFLIAWTVSVGVRLVLVRRSLGFEAPTA